MTLLEALDRLNERLARRRRAAGGLRQRLPRRHLRVLRPRGGRPPARAAAGDHHVPAPDARVPRRRHHHPGALPDRRLPRRARPGGGPRRARPRDAGGRLRLGPRRQRARGQYAPGRARGRRARARRGGSASAAAPAWPPAPMAPPRSSWAPSSPTSGSCRRASPSARDAGRAMVAPPTGEGFGGCSLHGECEAVCPKGIDLGVIATA